MILRFVVTFLIGYAATLPAFLNRSVQAVPRIVSPTEINVSLLLKNLSSLKLMTVIQYYVTRYRESHDDEGRASIWLDGKEIVKGCYFNLWYRWYYNDYAIDDKKLSLGAFDEWDFYTAFQEFYNQSIEKSLKSKNLIVRILAVLDRRIGKRRLLQMKETIQNEPVNFQTFFAIRMEAEGLS